MSDTEAGLTAVDAEVLRAERHGAVLHLELSRPDRRNALNAALVDALVDALDGAETDPRTRAIVLRGAGAGFCAGADLRHLLELHEAGASPVPFLRTVSALTRRIERSRLPVVAALHGHAVAGGLEIALACDAVVAETGTLIGDGHIRNHLVPAAGAAVRMRRALGNSLGRWLALSGELLPAEDLLACGWLRAVTGPRGHVAEGHRLAEVLAAAANPAQAAYKQMLADLDQAGTVEDGLDLELEAFDHHWRHHDVADELYGFFARRSTA